MSPEGVRVLVSVGLPVVAGSREVCSVYPLQLSGCCAFGRWYTRGLETLQAGVVRCMEGHLDEGFSSYPLFCVEGVWHLQVNHFRILVSKKLEHHHGLARLTISVVVFGSLL